jgi:hypothetical protein
MEKTLEDARWGRRGRGAGERDGESHPWLCCALYLRWMSTGGGGSRKDPLYPHGERKAPSTHKFPSGDRNRGKARLLWSLPHAYACVLQNTAELCPHPHALEGPGRGFRTSTLENHESWGDGSLSAPALASPVPLCYLCVLLGLQLRIL